MPFTGTLRTWHEDRGFGFIAPTHGGAEVFVHISAFPRDGSRPTQGEQLRYELGRGKNGQVQAVQVLRLAIGAPPPPRTRVDRGRQHSRLPLLAGLAALGIAAVVAHGRFGRRDVEAAAAPQPLSAPVAEPPAPSFRCDGRRHCSQMSSCAEAKFFLQNCPGVEMDGDHDGVPCEMQWCTSPTSP